MLKIKINPMALKDLKEIKEYIADETDSESTAVKVIFEIIKGYEALAEFPAMGLSLYNKIKIRTDYRCLISGDYYIFYKYDDECIFIHRILNGKRDYLKVLFDDDAK